MNYIKNIAYCMLQIFKINLSKTKSTQKQNISNFVPVES